MMNGQNQLGGIQATAATCAPPVKVWLVDDNNNLRMLVAEALGRYQDIQCARHFSSPDALLSELASKPGPDVILLDIQMGDRNGLDAVRPIKSLTRSTRVLMFTSCNDPAWRERAFSEGASDYLLKSCELDKMAERIRYPASNHSPSTCYRRRVKRPVENPAAGSVAKSLVHRTPRFLENTLNRFFKGWSARARRQITAHS